MSTTAFHTLAKLIQSHRRHHQTTSTLPQFSEAHKENINGPVDALSFRTIFIRQNTAINHLAEHAQLVLENGELKVEIYGELGALLNLGTEPKNEHPQAKDDGVQIMIVAGAGFEPATFKL